MTKTTLLLTTILSVGMVGFTASAAHAQSYSGQPAAGYNAAMSPTAPITDRIVSDPLYLPLKGQVYGSTTYTLAMPTGDHINGAGVKTSSFSNYNNTISQGFSYGLSDEFSVHVTEAYGFDESNKTSATTGNISTGNSEGFTDPTIGATYRVFDQARQQPVDVDLTFNYSPDMISATSPGGGNDGNVARGGQEASFGVGVGREMKMFTVEGVASATYVGQRMVEGLSNDSFAKYDPYMSYNFGVNTQTRFTDRFSMNLDAGYTLNDSYHASNTTSGLAWTGMPSDVLALTAGLNYHFVPNKLVGSLLYTYDDYTNTANDFANPALNNSQKNYSANVVAARLAYVFN